MPSTESNTKQSIDDGGPAFPIPIAEVQGFGTHSGEWGGRMTGMSLRDYFAAKALSGLLARSDSAVPHCDGCRPITEDAGEHYADIAYRYADALLAERAKGGA